MSERDREIRQRRHRKEKRAKLRQRLHTANEQERSVIEAKLLKTYPYPVTKVSA